MDEETQVMIDSRERFWYEIQANFVVFFPNCSLYNCSCSVTCIKTMFFRALCFCLSWTEIKITGIFWDFMKKPYSAFVLQPLLYPEVTETFSQSFACFQRAVFQNMPTYINTNPARGADLWKISCVLYSQIPCFLRKCFFQIQGMLGCIMQKNVYIHSPVCRDEWPRALYEKDTRVALTSLLHFNIQETLLNNRALHIFPHISLPQNTFLLNLLSADERLMDTQNSFSRLL